MAEEQTLVRDLNGFRAVMYMLFSIEAKLRVHTNLLIEMSEVITQKDPGVIKNDT